MKLFKILGTTLGLKLNANEQEELEAIDKEIQDQEELQYRREKTVDAYTLMHATQEALNTAQNSNGNQAQWLETLRRAQEADKLIQPLIEAKFHKLVSPETGLLPLFTLGTYVNTLALGCSIGVILSPLLRAVNMTPEEIQMTVCFYHILLCAPVFISFLLDRFQSELTRALSSTITEHVLDAAKRANVTLDPAHIIPAIKEHKLSNAQILEKIGISNVPERFTCPISYQIMDNPTFSRQHPARFDKESIHDWLKKRNIHPLEQGPLYRENLFIDRKLKQEIDRYLDKEKQVFIKTKKYIDLFVLKPLIEQSLFNHKPLIEDEEISDEMMLHSAFGQGSNTYKAKRG